MLLKDLLLDSGGGIVKLAVKLASPSCHLGPTRIPIENWLLVFGKNNIYVKLLLRCYCYCHSQRYK